MSNEFKLVPRDPTEEMDIEGQSVIEYGASAVYSAMVENYNSQPPALDGEPDVFVREVFLRNGFTIKEGQEDLKPYVYAAAKELTAPLQTENRLLRLQLGGMEECLQELREGGDPRKAQVDALQAEIECLKAELAWQEIDNQMQAAEIDQLKAQRDEPEAFLPPFATKVIKKLQRFEECMEDGQGADISKIWFDLLTQLELLNRVQRSPAVWEITKQGEDLLNGGINEPIPFCFIEDHSYCFLEQRTKEYAQAWRLNISTHRHADSDVPLYRLTKPAGSEKP